MADYVRDLYTKLRSRISEISEDRLKNIRNSCSLSYLVGLTFRLSTNWLYPSGQLADNFLFQPDEILRGPVGYVCTYTLDRVLRSKILRRYVNGGKFTKPLALLASFMFEVSQHLSPLPNEMLRTIGLRCDSTFLGSLEDFLMDTVTVKLYKSGKTKS